MNNLFSYKYRAIIQGELYTFLLLFGFGKKRR